MNIGSIVKYRNREWVVVASDRSELTYLRPLTGATDEVIAVHNGLSNLIGYSLPDERITSAQFPLPSPDDVSDAAGAHLLWQAARLSLREGAAPFRSLGRISIRPRTYQFVPLLMALRLDTIRLLIADDVGVGKTIEALLIARELLDRGEIKRLAVLCPPYLCDQWHLELTTKLNLDAVIIRSGTVNQLDRAKTGRESLYRFYPIQVISIDFIKSDRNKHAFLLDCPELVIVDEAHGSAVPEMRNISQHQRHELIHSLASRPNQNLILLTATPHSGIESAFRSLLGFLKSDFENWAISDLDEPRRIELARHFVQRTRKDIEKNWESEQCFPVRDPKDETYPLSPAYRRLFDSTYAFCTELVRTGQTLEKRHQRVRYWAALALLRCAMSSPAAACAAIKNRTSALPDIEDDIEYKNFVFESANDLTDDALPTPPLDAAEKTMPDSDRRRLRELGRLARGIAHTPDDTKLASCAKLTSDLLRKGFHPIIWCRYIATADYVAEGLQRALAREFAGVRVVSITGMLGDDERHSKVGELAGEKCRVLVATDCLSEGINLQEAFNAVLHYDLPWNPNRLEQREGRVDRYNQKLSKIVKTIRYFSPDNPVDGVVIRVLLDKAREIRRTLGTYVPVPDESETVTQAVLNALFLRGRETAEQLRLGFDPPEVIDLHRRWDLDAERERVSRTRFAQRAMKPEEVRRELEATDDVLGDPQAVRAFVLNAAQRLNLPIAPDPKKKDVFRIAISPEARAVLPDAVKFVLPVSKSTYWNISFVSPTPEGAEYLGRNHRFVAAMAQFLMEEALTKGAGARASRCGVIRTHSVTRPKTLCLLRVRYLFEQPDQPTVLFEEVQVIGWQTSAAGAESVMSSAEALRLLSEAKPDANVLPSEKREQIETALAAWKNRQTEVNSRLNKRAAELLDSHRRIRQAVSLKIRNLAVRPQHPTDLLGIVVYLPMVSP